MLLTTPHITDSIHRPRLFYITRKHLDRLPYLPSIHPFFLPFPLQHRSPLHCHCYMHLPSLCLFLSDLWPPPVQAKRVVVASFVMPWLHTWLHSIDMVVCHHLIVIRHMEAHAIHLWYCWLLLLWWKVGEWAASYPVLIVTRQMKM